MTRNPVACNPVVREQSSRYVACDRTSLFRRPKVDGGSSFARPRQRASLAHYIIAPAAALLIAAAPPTARFVPASQSVLPNGARVVSQLVADTPLLGAQLFVPGGVAQQPPDRAGIAGIAADMVLHTPVVGGQSVTDVATNLGGRVTFTLDPNHTRYTIDCRANDLPTILHALVLALAHPAAAEFSAARQRAADAADSSVKNPVATLLAMIRQIDYADTGFEYLDMGRPLTLARIDAAQTVNFVQNHARGGATVLALSGNVTQRVLDATSKELAALPAGSVPARPAAAKRVTRSHQVVAHRTVGAPWVGIGYQAPSQYSSDFPAMLVISALLGQNGDSNALSFGSAAPLPEDFIGAYYQYEAQPGALVIFLNGAEGSNIDQSVRELQIAIARLRAQSLPATILDRGRRLAIGQYYMEVTSLADAAWLEGRAAMSPQGLAFVDALPRAIARVSAADVRRVARAYLTHETVGVVLPPGGQ